MRSRTILRFGATEHITCSMIGSLPTPRLYRSMLSPFLVLSMKSHILIQNQSTMEWYTSAVLLKDAHTNMENLSSTSKFSLELYLERQ